jgi:cell wall-associated NlpC family hydrolase
MTVQTVIAEIQAISDRADALEAIRVTHDQQIADLNARLNAALNGGMQSWEVKADKIIAAGQALGKFNIPYAFGGDTFQEGGLDCSGFTKLLYGTIAGVTLPRVSGEQSKVGTAVAVTNVRKGDLLFFTYSQRNDGLPTHVGIYAGNGQMLHTNNDTERIHLSAVDLKTCTAIRRVFS